MQKRDEKWKGELSLDPQNCAEFCTCEGKENRAEAVREEKGPKKIILKEGKRNKKIGNEKLTQPRQTISKCPSFFTFTKIPGSSRIPGLQILSIAPVWEF